MMRIGIKCASPPENCTVAYGMDKEKPAQHKPSKSHDVLFAQRWTTSLNEPRHNYLSWMRVEKVKRLIRQWNMVQRWTRIHTERSFINNGSFTLSRKKAPCNFSKFCSITNYWQVVRCAWCAKCSWGYLACGGVVSGFFATSACWSLGHELCWPGVQWINLFVA